MSEPTIKLFLEGKEVPVPDGVVKVVFEHCDPDRPDLQLHLTASYEGLIGDTVLSGKVVHTRAMDWDVVAEIEISCAACDAEVVTLAGGAGGSGVVCPGCGGLYCDDCYDTGKGDGCACHAEEP